MSKEPRMHANKRKSILSGDKLLFERVVSILEQARGNVVRAVNTNMVLAYWLIGREIVEEVQRGKGRAEYGEQILADLSNRLAQRYGNGFFIPNLQNFRKFYLAYHERVTVDQNIQYPAGTEFADDQFLHPLGRELTPAKKSNPLGDELPQGFSPHLS